MQNNKLTKICSNKNCICNCHIESHKQKGCTMYDLKCKNNQLATDKNM